MSEQPQKSGLVVSAALHGALLAAILIGFAGAPKFDDADESIPVETVSQNQFNEIMKGERDAKPAKPVEKPAPPIEASAPKPPEQAQNEPPPRPPQRPEEPKPTPPQAAPTPPERPATPQKEAAAPPTPPPPPDAEIDRPQGRPDPQPPPTPPAPPTRPKAADRPKPDQLAKLFDEPKPNEPPKPPSKPKTSDASTERRYDPNSIAKLLSQGKPRNIEQVASTSPLGAPTANAQRLSPSLAAAIDGWLTDAYLRCWQPPPTMPEGAKYIAEIRVAFNPDGSLAVHPLLINPPSDPAWRAYADSAMRAVLRCNPLQVPPQYAPYFEQWRSKTVHFDPENALG